MRESDIERYLVDQVGKRGGETRKVAWVGRVGAPDRLVLLPGGVGLWVEVKGPDTLPMFPIDARERAQAREHNRMRALGQPVFVIGTFAGVDELLGMFP